jgi:NADH:ubiquinone oxidoreductase subunit F (NADH-binding)
MLDAPIVARSAPVGSQRLLQGDTATLAGHERRHGRLPDVSDRQIRAMVEEAGLTGRGGAGFPTHRKWAAVGSGGRPVVIGNAAEGEPASAKDRSLLRLAPHLVLDGLQLAARAIRARDAYLYVPAGAVDGVRAAITERLDRLTVTVHVAPDAFIAGEESAVVSAIGGGLPIPQDKASRILERGLHGRPTLVQNAETLAHVALIARHGPTWFRAAGTADEPGTFLATVSGAVGTPGVYEAPYAIDLGDLIAAAGGPSAPLQAVLVGGYHGAWVPAGPEIPISRAALAPFDAGPGAGVVVALPAHECGLVASARVVGYLSDQRANQCGPCVNALPRLADTLTALAHRRADPTLVTAVERLSRQAVGRGACRHPDGTVRFIRSSLRMFAGDVNAHLAGWCAATSGLYGSGRGR